MKKKRTFKKRVQVEYLHNTDFSTYPIDSHDLSYLSVYEVAGHAVDLAMAVLNHFKGEENALVQEALNSLFVYGLWEEIELPANYYEILWKKYNFPEEHDEEKKEEGQ